MGGALALAVGSLLALLSIPGVAQADTAQEALKISVDASGFYRLTHAELLQAGFPVNDVDPRLLTLTVGGAETALWVSGEEDGIFDSNDWLLFYGLPLDTLYTNTNVYWLTVGTQAGKRMATRQAPPDDQAPLAETFTETHHAEVNNHYWQTIPNGQGLEHWFWNDKLTAPASREERVELPGLAANTSATLRVHLRGKTTAPQIPHHQTRLRVNGTQVVERAWSGQVPLTLTAILPPNLAQAGANRVEVEALTISQSISQYFLDWIEFDYQRVYSATDDNLAFSGPGNGRFTFAIEGFTSVDPTVFDVTNPLQPVRLTGVQTEANNGGFRVRFGESSSAESRYLALTPAQWRTPALEMDTPSSWRSASQGADYILITHQEYLTAVVPLVAHRQAQGLRVAVVDVADVYDEFSDGIFTPQAIHDFLDYAWRNWQPPRPRFVVLVGDANIDYRDYLQTGTANTVPTQLVQSAILGDTPSDNWFVAVEGDDPVPEMSIGRLSVQSTGDAETIVAKIVAYEETAPTLEWGRRMVLVADDDSATFEVLSEKLADLLPKPFSAERVYASQIAEAERAQRVVSAFDKGALFVNYSGHGAVNQWGGTNAPALLGPSEIAGLTNGPRLPIVTVANCLSGFFAGPLPQVSLAERLQRLPNGGAIAVLAPTALNYPAGHEELFKAFYQALFSTNSFITNEMTLGEAMGTAKATVYSQSDFWGELVEMYVLFGDPAMTLSVPPALTLYLPAISTGE